MAQTPNRYAVTSAASRTLPEITSQTHVEPKMGGAKRTVIFAESRRKSVLNISDWIEVRNAVHSFWVWRRCDLS